MGFVGLSDFSRSFAHHDPCLSVVNIALLHFSSSLGSRLFSPRILRLLLLFPSKYGFKFCRWTILPVMVVLGTEYACGLEITSQNTELCKSSGSGLAHYLASGRKLWNPSSEGQSFFRPSYGTNLAIALISMGGL